MKDSLKKTLLFTTIKDNSFNYSCPIKTSLNNFCKNPRGEASPFLFEYLCYKIYQKNAEKIQNNEGVAVVSENYLLSQNCKTNLIQTNSIKKNFIFIPIRNNETHKWNAIIFVQLEKQILKYMNQIKDEPIIAKIISSNVNSEDDDYILNATMDRIERIFNFISPEDIQFEVDSINISDQPNTTVFLINFIEGLLLQENNNQIMEYIMKLYDESSNSNAIGSENYFCSFNQENEIFKNLAINYNQEMEEYLKTQSEKGITNDLENIENEEEAINLIDKENEEIRKHMEEQEMLFNTNNGNKNNYLGLIQEVENESDDEEEPKCNEINQSINLEKNENENNEIKVEINEKKNEIKEIEEIEIKNIDINSERKIMENKLQNINDSEEIEIKIYQDNNEPIKNDLNNNNMEYKLEDIFDNNKNKNKNNEGKNNLIEKINNEHFLNNSFDKVNILSTTSKTLELLSPNSEKKKLEANNSQRYSYKSNISNNSIYQKKKINNSHLYKKSKLRPEIKINLDEKSKEQKIVLDNNKDIYSKKISKRDEPKRNIKLPLVKRNNNISKVDNKIPNQDCNQEIKKNTIIINGVPSNNTVINFIEIKNNYNSENKKKSDIECLTHIPEDGMVNSISTSFYPNKTIKYINNQENYKTISYLNDYKEQNNQNVKMKTYSNKFSEKNKLKILDNYIYPQDKMNNNEMVNSKESKDDVQKSLINISEMSNKEDKDEDKLDVNLILSTNRNIIQHRNSKRKKISDNHKAFGLLGFIKDYDDEECGLNLSKCGGNFKNACFIF